MSSTRKTKAPTMTARWRRLKRRGARHADLAFPVCAATALVLGLAALYWPGADVWAPILIGTGVLALWVWMHP